MRMRIKQLVLSMTKWQIVKFIWVPSHYGIKCNKEADILAKEVALVVDLKSGSIIKSTPRNWIMAKKKNTSGVVHFTVMRDIAC